MMASRVKWLFDSNVETVPLTSTATSTNTCVGLSLALLFLSPLKWHCVTSGRRPENYVSP